MRRLAGLATVAVVLGVALSTLSLASASAEETVLEYSGTRSNVYTTPAGVVVPGESEQRTVTLRCDAGRCTVSGISTTGSDEPIVLVDGRASYSYPANGTACDPPESRAEDVTVEATFTTLLAVVDRKPQGPDQCGDTTVQRSGTTLTYDLVLVSGDPCALDNSCAAQSAEPVTGVDPGAAPVPDASRPTVLSTLATTDEAITTRNVAWAAIGTVVLVILIALPTELFNSAVSALLARINAWWRRRRGLADGASSAVVIVGLPAALGGVAIGAVISAFIDPEFGLTLPSLRLVVSLVVGFAVSVVLGWMVTIALVRRTRPGTTTTFEFAPLSLLIVVAAVAFSRLTSFEPGIVFGLVAGVVVGGALATADRGRLTVVTLGYSYVLAVVAWVVYSAVGNGSDAIAPLVFVRETLSAIAVAGIAALPIVLLPLSGLAGRTLWEWRRSVWAVAYGFGVFGFLLVLMPAPFAWGQVGASIWAWAGLYVLYFLAGLAAWVSVRLTTRAT